MSGVEPEVMYIAYPEKSSRPRLSSKDQIFAEDGGVMLSSDCGLRQRLVL